MSKLLLIDADSILYRAGFATEKTRYLVTDAEMDMVRAQCDDAKAAKDAKEYDTDLIWSRKEVEPEEKALMLADVIVRDICDRYPQHKPELWLSPSVGNFRDVLATRAKYKGNRDGAARPTHFKAIKQHLLDKYNARETVGQEADDALGIGMSANPDSVCVSFDKDLLQIPGTHYDWTKKEEVVVSKREGALNFWSQVLSGDPVDNVPGIEGIGPVKARKLLVDVKTNADAEKIVRQAYTDKYGPELGNQYFLETAALVWVRREPNKGWATA